jgi:hypothetical protein
LLAAGVALGYPTKPSTDIVWEKWSPETVARLGALSRANGPEGFLHPPTNRFAGTRGELPAIA